MSGRYVEMAVCESCGRFFHQASMRGVLCPACAAKAAPRESAEPPRGFVAATCPDCGATFMRPARANGQVRCWKCADRRAAAAQRLRRRRPVVFEDAVCPDCGQTFRRPSSEDRPGRPWACCRECARKRKNEAYRRLRARRAAAN